MDCTLQFITLNPHFFRQMHPVGYEKRLNYNDCIGKIAQVTGASAAYIAKNSRRVLPKASVVDPAFCHKVVIVGLFFFALMAIAAAGHPPSNNSTSLAFPSNPSLSSYSPLSPESYRPQTTALTAATNSLVSCEHINLRTQVDYIKECLAVNLTSEMLAKKIVVSEPGKRQLLLDVLTEMRKERGAREFYIDFVLKHPGLTFDVGEVADDGAYAWAIFSLNQIKVSNKRLQSTKSLKNILYHELWHFYQVYVNGNYADPRTFSIKELAQLKLPYSSTSKKLFEDILERGKKNLNNPVIPKNQLKLFEDYQPRHFDIQIPRKEFENFRQNVDTLLAKKQFPQINGNMNNKQYTLFIESYSIKDNLVLLTGYTVSNLSEKHTAFVRDLWFEIHTHHQSVKLPQSYDDLEELDAVLQEFDPKHVDFFFERRRIYHDRKLEKMWGRVNNLPIQEDSVFNP